MNCMACGKPLAADEIAVHKKLINRGAKEYMCIGCLSSYFHVNEQLVREKIEYFKREGCTLFK